MRVLQGFITIMSFITIAKSAHRSREQELIEYLKTNYSKEAHPTLDSKSAINISFELEFIQLMNVDERNQHMENKVWVRLKWQNELMTWDPSEWNNITHVQMDPETLWTPDIVLYNNVDDMKEISNAYETRITIYSNGINKWHAPSSFKSTCNIDVRAFPFDTQHCHLKFGSWTFDSSKIYLVSNSKEFVTSEYVNSSEWHLQTVSHEINNVKYNCCPDFFMDVTFNMTISRKPLYHVFNVIIPCLILVATVLISFFLPPDSGERIGLTLTVLLAFAVFMNVISGTLPKNSDSTPMVSTFFIIMMGESAFSLVTTCIVLVVHHRSGTPLPRWVRKLFLARRKNSDAKSEKIVNSIHGYNLEELKDLLDPSFHLKHESKEITTDQFQPALNAIFNDLHVIAKDIRVRQSVEETQEEWQQLGKALDKLFFVVFLLTVTISAIAILMPVYLKRYNFLDSFKR